MQWNLCGRTLAGGLERGAERAVRRVRLGRCREIDHHLGQRQITLWGPEHVERVAGSNGQLERLRVGEPDVFGCHRDRAAEDRHRILTALDHARHPVECGLWIAPAQRLVVGREHVEVDFAAFVMVRKPLLHRVAGDCHGDPTPLPHVIRRSFENRESPARIAIGFAGDDLAGIVIHFEIQAAKTSLFVEQRAIYDRPEVSLGERIENEHAHAREERVVQLERWILSRGADEGYRSRFDVREKRVLLCLVEAVDFVHEEDRLASHLEPLLRLGHHLAHSWNPFGDGREGDEVAIGVLGDQSAEGGFAGAGRAPEYHGLYRALLDRVA